MKRPKNKTLVIVKLGDVKEIAGLSRYQAFTHASGEVAEEGNIFVNIAEDENFSYRSRIRRRGISGRG
jgi:hypothetical protein